MESIVDGVGRLCDSNLWNFEDVWNTTTPQLSACFHETVFVWSPAAILWLLLPYQLVTLLSTTKRPIHWNIFNSIRQSLSISSVIIAFISCIFLLFYPSPTSNVIANLIQLITKVLLCLLLYFHRLYGVHTSGTVWLYLLFETVLGTISVYSYSFHIHREYHQYYLYLIQYVISLSLFIVCSFSDQLPVYSAIPSDPKKKPCPKERASFPSKLTFWWFNSLAVKGWKKPIDVDDLWDARNGDKCENVFRQFNKTLKLSELDKKFVETLGNDVGNYWLKRRFSVLKNEGKRKKYELFKAIGKTFWFYFVAPSVMRLFGDLMVLTNPLILKLLIRFTGNDEPSWHGLFYAGVFIASNILQSLVNAYHQHRMSALGLRIRNCLIASVYRKSLSLSNSAKKVSTTGQIVNLMAVDAQRFMDLLPFINFLWSAPFQIGLTLWLLWYELGVSVFAGLVLMIALVPANGLIARIVKKYQLEQMKLKDQRIKTMNELLGGIKVIKLYGWEEAFMNNILSIRMQEISLLRKSGYIQCILMILGSCSAFFVSLITFACYIFIDDSNVLTAEKAFVSISLFMLLRMPMVMVPNMINSMILTFVSIKRITKFLNQPDLTDYVNNDPDKDVVSIVNGEFAWSTEDQETDKNEADKETKDKEESLSSTSAILSGINLKVSPGQFVAIVGHVGSGKSSIINAILGEMEIISGKVNVNQNTKIAYVPQQAWILNATVKDNILFGKDYDYKTYKTVIKGCALEPDLMMLAGGDETEIGEKGINLSGGQKQRVSLARAVYQDADLYLMDDPLSAVDSHVGKHLMDQVLSSKSGLLKDKTRILATNSLFVLQDVDLIVVLKDGKIADVGTYDQLMDKKGDFAEMIDQYSSRNEENQEEAKENIELGTPVTNKPRDRTATEVLKRSDDNNQDKSKLIEDERPESGGVALSVYSQYVKAITPTFAFGIIFSYIMVQVSIAGSNFWLAHWTDSEDGDSHSGYYLAVFGAIGLVQMVFVGTAWASIVTGCLLASKKLHYNLLFKILRAPMSFFDTTPIGRVLNRFSKDIDVLDTALAFTTRVLISCFFQVITIVFIITFYTQMFLVVVVPMVIIYYFIQKFYVTTLRQLRRLDSVSRSPIYNHFSETLTGASSIRAYGVHRRFIHESDIRVDGNQLCLYPSQVANCWLQVRLDFLASCTMFFAALFAVLGRNTLNPSDVGLSISYSLSITLVLNWTVRMFADFETNIVAVERIDEYCRIESEAEWKSGQPPKEGWPDQGVVGFDGYSTRYREGLDLVLKSVDLHVVSKEKIGIVGRTGAGKSSLTLALFRLIEPDSGTIIIDGVDVRRIGLHELRSKLTIIPQDPVLFSGTIRTNLDPFKQHSDDQLWHALEHAHLKSFVAGLDMGLDYVVSENGDNLSVGQRQLMCLARALLRRTKILVLDEATAAVDPETDSLIQNTIREQFKECTILVIAHRLNTIIDSDRVLVLDKGRVAEFDSPKKLIADETSIFHSLAKDAGLVQ